MGTWGSGNFQSDGALDYLGDVVGGFVKRIDEILEEEGLADADEAGESELVPTVALIDLVCRNCSAAPPQLDKIVAWRRAYLAVYDVSMPGLDPKGEFLKERRAVIEKTFTSLEQYAQGFWKD